MISVFKGQTNAWDAFRFAVQQWHNIELVQPKNGVSETRARVEALVGKTLKGDLLELVDLTHALVGASELQNKMELVPDVRKIAGENAFSLFRHREDKTLFFGFDLDDEDLTAPMISSFRCGIHPDDINEDDPDSSVDDVERDIVATDPAQFALLFLLYSYEPSGASQYMGSHDEEEQFNKLAEATFGPPTVLGTMSFYEPPGILMTQFWQHPLDWRVDIVAENETAFQNIPAELRKLMGLL